METAGLAALVTAVADVAGFVGADWRDVVPVTNATTGVNAVLQSLKLQKGDLILMTNATYAAVSEATCLQADAGAGYMAL
jgi:isopenicillin-N epimerase